MLGAFSRLGINVEEDASFQSLFDALAGNNFAVGPNHTGDISSPLYRLAAQPYDT
jgi:hypothetical protein